MKLAGRLAFLALILSPVAAFGDSSPQVVMATPGVGGGKIERFTMRFSEPMVALGDPRAAAPVDVTCAVPGEGRWIDQQTYVHEFGQGLPGDTRCTFALRQGLKSSAGFDVTGQRNFSVDSGGPTARAVLPSRYGSQIEEDQVFLVASNAPATRASIAANAYCAVDGLGEKIAVDLLEPDVPGKLIAALETDWSIMSFLEEAGLPTTLPAAMADRRRALASVVALRCRRPLPPGRDVALIWSGKIATAGGKLSGIDQRFDYTVRKPFTARFECARVNARAGCSPVEQAWVRFTAPMPTKLAAMIRIQLPDGKMIAPVLDDDSRRKAMISDISFAPPLPFATAAKLVLPPGIKDESGRPLANAARFPLDIRFDEAPPLIKFAGEFGILEASEGGVLPVTVRNVEPALQGRRQTVVGQSMRVTGSDGEIAQWLRTVERADDYKVDTRPGKPGAEDISINRTASRPILAPSTGKAMQIGLPGKGKAFEVVGIPLGKPGFYVVELASPALGQALLGRRAPRYVATAALVTNMAVHFKWGRGRSLVWVTSLDRARPVANAEVRVTDSCTGKLLARGLTDASGGLYVSQGLPDPESYGSCPRTENDYDGGHPLMVSARAGDDFSFTLSSWGEGIRPSDFEMPFGYSAPQDILHTIFDRTLLRQGDTIHMKHLLRKQVALGVGRAQAFKGSLKLVHRGSDTTFEVPITLGKNGAAETQWTAPPGAPMGDYDLQVERDGDTIYTGQSFRIDEFRLPTMRASVTGPKTPPVHPRNVPVDLFVGYLSGGGAARLPVDLRVAWSPGQAAAPGYEAYNFGGAAMVEGVRPLGGGEQAQSTLPPTQTLPITLGADGAARTALEVPQTLDGAADMQVEMDYQDANGEVLTASRRISILPSAVRIGIRADGWLMKQDDMRLRLVAIDPEGKPIAGQRIDIALYRRDVLTARRRLIGGFYAYDNQERVTRLPTTCSVKTDAQGLALCKLDPGVSGEVSAVATAPDSDGNIARSVQSVWLAGDDDWWFGGDNGDRMDLVPERTEYKAGETARFQVRMSFRAATALVTVEREGVLSSYVKRLSGRDPVVEVKMPGSYAPNVFVSVMVVRERVTGFWSWLANLARSWGLPVGSPENAPPTALVDLAKPAYRIGMAQVKVGLEAYRLQVDVKADRQRYAARDVAQVDVAVRTPGGKPAATADLAFVAVDEALLQLSPNESWDVLSAMMGERPLSVLTATAQGQVVGKRHYGRKAVEAGGGGGDLSGLNRENFQPVLLWRGRVPLDARGHARVAVPLSDALTSFKLVAIASDGFQTFGTGETTIRASQDLSIFAGIPPVARTGDRFAATFTLRNGSARAMTVTANVTLSPAIARGKPLTVTIPAGAAVPVAWNLSLPGGPGNLRWTVSARSSDGRARDSIGVDQEIVPLIPVTTWAATLLRVGPDTLIPVAAPVGALPGRGTIDVALTDTLAPSLASVRSYMAAYPYNCFEQRLSRLVATGDAAAWAVLAGEIPTYQAPDGLLRYFPSDSIEGSEALTAYVLAITSDAGLTIPTAARARMVEALTAVVDGRLRNERYGDERLQRLDAFSALARAGAAKPAMLGQIGLTPGEMPTAQLADYIVALDRVPGLANAAALRASAEAVLRSRLVFEGTRLDLSDQNDAAWWLMSSGDEAAIKALIAVLGRPGWQDDAPRMMTGVGFRQVHGHWDNTTANAWGSIATRKFTATYGSDPVTGTTTATIGRASQRRAWPLAVPGRTLAFPLPAAASPLRLSHVGGQSPWATISVSAAVPLQKPLSAGYRLTRQVSVVQARKPGTLSRGDVIRVTLTVDASAERNWVVVSDPVPAGATIVSDLGGQSRLLAAGETGEGVSPSYVERGGATWRGYFAWVPRGRFSVSYTARLNAAGRFSLPPSRVEAMYSPAIHAAVPNAPVSVAAR